METETADLPVRCVTIDQVVAWNIAWYRQQSGLTQRELGRRLGWTNAKVSEAERSWDGRRTREFNAQELAGLSLALGVPLAALLLPPEDDGAECHYAFAPPGHQGEPLPMAELMGAVIMTDSGAQTEIMDVYRERFHEAAGAYLDPDWLGTVAEWLSGVGEAAMRADRAERLRSRALALVASAENAADAAEAAAVMLGELADAIDPEGGESHGG